ncbi:hypothetical protein [Pseudomonas sp. HLT2-19-2]
MTGVLQRVGDAVEGQGVIEVEEQRFGFGIDLDEVITGASVGVIASDSPAPFGEKNHQAAGGTTDIKQFALGGHIVQVPTQVCRPEAEANSKGGVD